MIPLVLTPVAPIGKRIMATFHGRYEVDDYPPSPRGRAVRDLRVELGLGLRDTAMALGLTAVQLSDLERGRATTDWDEVERRVRALAGGVA